MDEYRPPPIPNDIWEYPSITVKVGRTKNGRYWQSYIDSKEWEWWELGRTVLPVWVWGRAHWRDEPTMWKTRLSSVNRIMVPQEHFEPGQLIQIVIVEDEDEVFYKGSRKR